MSDFANVYAGETIEFTHNGRDYVATIEHDESHGAPWEEHDGHGDVSEWTTRDKLPGEIVLTTERHGKRFYDFAGACKIARRDGWGFMPGGLKTEKLRNGYWRATGAGLVSHSRDINAATSDVYKRHRASMTARQYAAGAAMADYECLRKWCNDQWFFCGVVVRRKDACECCGMSERLWGIESSAGDYLEDVARELAEQLEDVVTDCAA